MDQTRQPGKAAATNDAQSASGGAAAAAVPGKQTQAGAKDAHGAKDKEAKAASAGGGGGDVDGVNLSTLQSFIEKHEGNVDHVYRDSRGFLTAGIGHLLPQNGPYRDGEAVSQAQVAAWFKQDTSTAISGARADMGASFDQLAEARKIVVIDMVFNLGAGSSGFGGFHATIAAIRAGQYGQAATDMLQSLWASQVGARATQDAAIMRSGSMSGVGGSSGEGSGTTASGGGATGASSNAPTLAQVKADKGVLKLGEHGTAVADVQKLLHVASDGIFGDQTMHAVESFQKAHHLEVDGVVGKLTLAALESKPATSAPATGGAKGGDSGGDSGGAPIDGTTGGVAAPGAGTKPKPPSSGGSDPKSTAKGTWTAAPPIAKVKSGIATLHEGEKGPAVKTVQSLAGVAADGEFGPDTKAAIVAFQEQHHEERHDGVVDAHTLALLIANPAGSIKGESKDGQAQRGKLLSIARAASAGKRPDGYCYKHVCEFLVACHGYGKIVNPYTQFPSADLPYAHDFADLMNSQAAKFGIERLSMSSPYSAPSGSIVVVAAGSPGTANPVAGDISVADGHGDFYNGGMMSYGGPAGWSASPRANLLGVYVPK